MRRLWEWWQARPALRATLLLMGVGLLLNVGPATLVKACGVPLYIDCVGTVLTAILGGALPAALVGFSTNAVNALSDPDAVYYGVISIVIAAVAAFYHHQRMFQTPRRLCVVIATLAAIGGGVGAALTYFLYGFDLGGGAAATLAQRLHRWLGASPFVAEVTVDLAIDLVDKALVVFAALWLCRRVPRGWRRRLDRVFLHDLHHVAADKPILHSLLRKVILAVVAAELLLGGLTCCISYFLYRAKSLEHFTDLANGVTHHAACVIDPARVGEFLEKGRAAPGYAATEKMLTDVKRSFRQTKYLYVYRILPDGCHVVFDLPSDEDATPGNDVEPGKPGEVVPFDESFLPYLPQLLKGEPIEPLISDDTYGWLLTAYTPLKDAGGATVAYVAADISMETLRSDVAMFFIRVLTLYFGLSIVIMSAVIELVKRAVILPVNLMSTAATKFAFATTLADGLDSEKVDLARVRHAAERVGRLRIHSRDEIGYLFDSFSTMTLNTYDFIEQVQRQAERINQMQEIIITEFAEVVEARDKSTGDHVKKTAAYVEALARQLQKEGKYPGEVTDEFIMKLKRSAPLHDIGKIAVSDLILNKQGKLTDEEFRVMKSHTVEGWKFFTKMVADAGDAIDPNYLKESIEMAHYHHEKWDGSGYPDGLKGEEIPLSARIMAVADVFDALIAERVYKKPFTYEKAMAIVTEGAGKHFDPVVVEAFTHIAEQLYRERTVLARPPEGSETAAPGADAQPG